MTPNEGLTTAVQAAPSSGDHKNHSAAGPALTAARDAIVTKISDHSESDTKIEVIGEVCSKTTQR